MWDWKAAPMIKAALDKHLESIFGCSVDIKTEVKVGKLMQVLKYNAIVQNLAQLVLIIIRLSESQIL